MLIEPRKKAKKLSYKGIYAGAKVVRGIDWSWEDQDNVNLKGKVIQIREWNQSAPLSGAYVQWENGTRNLYRLGFEGMVSEKKNSLIYSIFYKYLFQRPI